MEQVAANIECDIPDALIDEQCARFLEEFKQRLQSQGIPYDQSCKMTNMDEAKFLEEGKEPATRQVRMDLAVNAIIKEEKLEATDEEVEKQYNDLAEKYSMDVGELKKYLDAMSVRTQIIRDKAISVVVDSAKIEKKKAPKKEAEGAAAAGGRGRPRAGGHLAAVVGEKSVGFVQPILHTHQLLVLCHQLGVVEEHGHQPVQTGQHLFDQIEICHK